MAFISRTFSWFLAPRIYCGTCFPLQEIHVANPQEVKHRNEEERKLEREEKVGLVPFCFSSSRSPLIEEGIMK